jgi:hypothetical protein
MSLMKRQFCMDRIDGSTPDAYAMYPVTCDRVLQSGQIGIPHFSSFFDVIRLHPLDNLVVSGQKEINI